MSSQKKLYSKVLSAVLFITKKTIMTKEKNPVVGKRVSKVEELQECFVVSEHIMLNACGTYTAMWKAAFMYVIFLKGGYIILC